MIKSYLLIAGLFIYLNSVAQRIATGKVVDQQENAVSNVRIQERGTANVTYSQGDGTYLLVYFDSETPLIFTHEDFDTVVLKLKAQNSIVFLSPKWNSNNYNLAFLAGFTDFTHKNTNKNLENMPYFLGESDVNRQLQMLPGIEQGREGYSNLFVRGGEADQNVMLYNGTPIYNSNHIYGISSVFHHRSIKNTAVYKGIAPARYGGRASSYIDLSSEKNAKFSSFSGEFEMTPLNAGIYLSNIEKDKKYFTISARRSWIDLLLPTETRENSINTNIYDLQLNMGKTLKNKDKIDFSFMSTRDLYFIAFARQDTNAVVASQAGFKQKWSNILTSIKHTSRINANTTVENTAYYSGYRASTAIEQQLFTIRAPGATAIPTQKEESVSGIRDIGLQSHITYLYNNEHQLSYGIQSATRFFQVGRREYSSVNYPSISDVFVVTGSPKYDATQEIALYAEDDFRVNDNTILNLGVRQVFFVNDKKSFVGFEPRIHGTFYLKNSDVFKIGYNRHNQYVSQLNLGTVGSPSNIWVPATKAIGPQKMDIVEAAYERKLGKVFAGSINGFYKRLQNLNLVKNLSDASDPSIDWQSSVTQGTGQVYGVELMLQRSSGYFNGWISYAYSKSTRNFQELFAQDFDFTYDRPHMLKIHANYTNENDDWNFGFNIIVGSGQLFTLPIGKFRDINGETQLEYNTLNNYRSPLYTRIDLSLVRLKPNYGLNQEWRFYLFNALGNRNPLNISVDFDGNSNFKALPINRAYLAYVPGIAYIVKF